MSNNYISSSDYICPHGNETSYLFTLLYVFWPWWRVEEVQKKVTIQQLAESQISEHVFLYNPIPKQNIGEQLQK